MENYSTKKDAFCPAEKVLNMISGRWKILILQALFSEVKRFNELQRTLPKITQNVLTQQLRELETDGLINRLVYPEVPPRVEYSLTPLGESLKPMLLTMHDWAIALENSDKKSQI